LAAAAGAIVAITAGGATGGVPPITTTPEHEVTALACGQGPTMVVKADRYVKSASGQAATSPAEALDRLLAAHYPKAPRALLSVAESGAGEVKFHLRAPGGPLLASFLVGSLDGEYWVKEVALCEATARGWAR
jgi:hypothetical protein